VPKRQSPTVLTVAMMAVLDGELLGPCRAHKRAPKSESESPVLQQQPWSRNCSLLFGSPLSPLAALCDGAVPCHCAKPAGSRLPDSQFESETRAAPAGAAPKRGGAAAGRVLGFDRVMFKPSLATLALPPGALGRLPQARPPSGSLSLPPRASMDEMPVPRAALRASPALHGAGPRGYAASAKRLPARPGILVDGNDGV
jgi:hypothetical protein